MKHNSRDDVSFNSLMTATYHAELPHSLLFIALSSQAQQQELRGVDSWRRADIWALGCTVLEMLNGTVTDSTTAAAATASTAAAADDDDSPRSCALLQFTTACSDFVQLCMQTEPTDRPSALQLLQHSFVAAPSVCSSSYGNGSGGYSSGSYAGDSPQRLARHSFDSPGSTSDAALHISSSDTKLQLLEQQHYSSNCSNSSSSGRAPAADLQVPSPVVLYSRVPARRHCWTEAPSTPDAATAGVIGGSSDKQWLNATAAAAVGAAGRSSPASAFASSSSDDSVACSVPADASVTLSRAAAEQQYASTRLLRPRALSLPRLLSNNTALHTSESLFLSSSAHATASELATQDSTKGSGSATVKTKSLPSLLFKRRVSTVSTSPVSVASGLAGPGDDSSTAPAAVSDCSVKLYESVGRVRARRHSAPTASSTSSGTSPQWWLRQSDAAVETPTHSSALQQQQQQQQQSQLSHSSDTSAAVTAAATATGTQQDVRQQRRRTSWTAGSVHSGSSGSNSTSRSALLSSSLTSRSAQASPDARPNSWAIKRGGLPPPVPLNASANTSALLSASAAAVGGSVMRLVSPRTLVQAQYRSSSGSSSSSGKRGRSPSHDSMPILRATYPAAQPPSRDSSVSTRTDAAAIRASGSGVATGCGIASADSCDSSTRRVISRSRSVDELTRAPRQLASSNSFSSSSTNSYSHASMTAAIAQSWLTAARTSLAVRLQRRLDRGLPVSDECLAWLSDEHEQYHSLQLQRHEQRHLQATAASATDVATAAATAATATAQRGRKQRRTWSPDDELELSTVSSMDYRRTRSSGWCNSSGSVATACDGVVANCDADLMLLEEGLLPLHSDSVHSMQLQQQQQQQQQDDAVECLSVSSCASMSDGAGAVHSDSSSVSSSSSSSSVSCDDAAAVPEVRAVADYQGDDASELSFKAGDIIEVLQETESGWWLGVLVEHAVPADSSATSSATDCAVVHGTSSTALGTRGFFPCTFVEWLQN
jgi:serine/threonine protein kinase